MANETNWWMIVALVALALLLFSGIGRFGWCGSSYNGYGGMMSWMYGGSWLFMGIFMLIFWIAIIFIIIWLMRRLTKRSIRPTRRGSR